MTDPAGTGTQRHIPQLADDLSRAAMSRREFVRTATLMGLSATAAFQLADRILGVPGSARAAEPADVPKAGGTLRCSMNVKEISDPAIYDWSEKANVARHMVEPLVRVGADNISLLSPAG